MSTHLIRSQLSATVEMRIHNIARCSPGFHMQINADTTISKALPCTITSYWFVEYNIE